LNFTHTGDTTEVVAYVSPNKARFFTLSAEHFFGVRDIYTDVRTISVFRVLNITSCGVEWFPEIQKCVAVSNTTNF